MSKIVGRNRLFTAVLVVAALLRLDAELGYRWQSWFNDSWDYVDTAVTLSLSQTRTSGYSLYLTLLEPFHSFALVTISQHLMGLACGVMIYALARHRFRCPAWLATLMSLPVLLDGFEIQLEHLVMSDTVFLFLTMASLFVLLWSPLRKTAPGTAWWRTSWFRCALSGLLIGLAALVRSTGLPLMPLFGLWILLVLALARPGWKTFLTSAVAFGVTAGGPMVAYAGWYDLQNHTLNTSQSTGIFLYSRAMTFADCAKMGSLPVDLLPLCSTVPPARRPIAQAYIWTDASPLNRFPESKFSPIPNALAEQFAIKAIEAQPLDYAKTVYNDTARAFQWNRTVFPNDATYDEYLFGWKPVPVAGGHKANGYKSSAQAYVAGGNPGTVIVNPFAGMIRLWQRYVYLPGTVAGVILLFGLAFVILGWRRRAAGELAGTAAAGETGSGGAGLAAVLPWLTSFGLILTPAATAQFDYRYVTTALPFACLALAMAYGASKARLAKSGSAVPVSASASADVTDVAGGLGTGGEAGGTAGLAGDVTGSGLGDAAADAGDDQRDLTPDASRRGV